LRLVLRDGRELEHRVDQPLGDPRRPMDDAALAAKFSDCARCAVSPLDPEAAAAAAARIAALEDAPDLAALAL
jgi:2-methylcitrate dehydratase PrpD